MIGFGRSVSSSLAPQFQQFGAEEAEEGTLEVAEERETGRNGTKLRGEGHRIIDVDGKHEDEDEDENERASGSENAKENRIDDEEGVEVAVA